MAERGGQPGNQNAIKSKQWSAAIERALARRGDPSLNPDEPFKRTPFMKGIDAAADGFIAELFAKYELNFFKELGDRIEGKPHITVSGADGQPIFAPHEWIVRDDRIPKG